MDEDTTEMKAKGRECQFDPLHGEAVANRAGQDEWFAYCTECFADFDDSRKEGI